MCENCMHLEYDEGSQQYVCSIDFIMDENNLANKQVNNVKYIEMNIDTLSRDLLNNHEI